MTQDKKGVLFAFCAVICFAAVSPVGKIFMREFPDLPFRWLVQIRLTVGAVFFLALGLIRHRSEMKITLRQLCQLTIVGILGLFAVQYTLFAALETVTVGVASFVQATAVIMVCLYSIIFLKEKFNLSKTVGLVVGFSGMAVIFYSPGMFHGGLLKIGLLWAFLSACSKAFYTAFLKSVKVHPQVMLAYAFATGAVFSWLLGPSAMFQFFRENYKDPRLMILLAVLTLIGTCLSFFLYFTSVSLTLASTVALITIAEPMLSTICAFIAVGEMITLKDGIGCGMILCGILAMQFKNLLDTRHIKPPENTPKETGTVVLKE